jgi:hypothetical protein
LGNEAVVAAYKRFEDAEEAVRQLEHAGVPMERVSIIGKDWRVRQDVQGFYTPKDAAKEGAAQGAWIGGLFGILWGAGFFLLPIAGPLVVLGPLAGLIAGAVGGAGIGALVSGLIAMGIPKEEALKYQTRLEAGEFLVVVHGTADEVAKGREILQGTKKVSVDSHAGPAGQTGVPPANPATVL